MVFTQFMRRVYLEKGSVFCSEDGLFVGSVPLLKRDHRAPFYAAWSVRDCDSIERDLTACYRGLPVDIACKLPGLEPVARALNRADMVHAMMVALHLDLPHPAKIAKGAFTQADLIALAQALLRSGMLKDWDSAKHPRLGGPPNRGRFANKPESDDEPKIPKPPTGRRPWPTREGHEKIKQFIREEEEKLKARAAEIAEDAKRAAGGVVEGGEEAARMAGPLIAEGAASAERGLLALIAREPGMILGPEGAMIQTLLGAVLEPEELNGAEDFVTAEIRANFDPPKTLEELEVEPPDPRGYDEHHIVEQNPSNIEKRVFVRFGRDRIDAPDNTVWIPRWKHRGITGEYNSKGVGDGRVRDDANKLDFDEQRQIGLRFLRDYGVLK